MKQVHFEWARILFIRKLVYTLTAGLRYTYIQLFQIKCSVVDPTSLRPFSWPNICTEFNKNSIKQTLWTAHIIRMKHKLEINFNIILLPFSLTTRKRMDARYHRTQPWFINVFLKYQFKFNKNFFFRVLTKIIYYHEACCCTWLFDGRLRFTA